MSTVSTSSVSAGSIGGPASGRAHITRPDGLPNPESPGSKPGDSRLPLWPSWLRQIETFPLHAIGGLRNGVNRRWRRERRRRAIGRAYDMALEIAGVVPRHGRVLDVGCGNGYIAHHLSALLGTDVVGIDLGARTSAPIDYRPYDGAQFPVPDNSFDAILLCYVLHHAQDVRVVLGEMRRALRHDGQAIIYEDIPQTWPDRLVCRIHNRQWQHRTGRCTFRQEPEWRALFESFGFEILTERPLSRWRNLTHPVGRRFFLLKLNNTNGSRNPASTRITTVLQSESPGAPASKTSARS